MEGITDSVDISLNKLREIVKDREAWLAAVTIYIDLGPKKMKSDTVFIFSPSVCREVIGLDAMIFIF